MTDRTAPRGLLARLGLDRPELRAWAMYDWANSAFMTVVITAVFPNYFSSVVADGLAPADATARYGFATTLALVFIAVLSPILGVVADRSATKLRLLATFLAIGAAATAAMFFVQRGEWIFGLALFMIANIGINGSFVFYDALLPHVARPDEVDRVSTTGYALGYVGGGLCLALALALILTPATFGLPSGPGLTSSQATLPVRLGFLLTAVWWIVFAIPLFRRVSEPPAGRSDVSTRPPLAQATHDLLASIRELRGFPQALLLLVAFLIYNDGIGTIIRMATIYGTEIGLGRNALIEAIVLVQFVGIPFAFLFGALAGRIGAKRAILGGLVVYVLITLLAFRMRTERDFMVLAILVGMVQGGTQALSRSLFARLIPRQKSGEFFGMFGVFEKFAGIFGPAVFSVVVALTGTSRAALLSLVVFFVIGGLLLLRIDVTAGERAARAAEG